MVAACAAVAMVTFGCSGETDDGGSAGTAAAAAPGAAGQAATGAPVGPTTPTPPLVPTATSGAGGTPASTGGSGGANATAGTEPAAGTSGAAGAAGMAGTAASDAPAAGMGDTPATGGGAPIEPGPDQPTDYALDCGPSGIALESAGPPDNRLNYVIVGDAYTEADLETTYVEHLERMLDRRFTPELEPYLRYRRFVNICALKVASQQSGVGTSAGNTAFDGYGNDGTRLGYINDSKVFAAIEDLLPPEIEVDWTAVVLNGDRWWNSGGRIMVWSGGHRDAALAAMHEGGHSFQRLADEYGGNCTFSGDESRMRINVTMDSVNTAGKWTQWLDFVQDPGTGLQSTFEGAQYCDRGAWRPSQESVMNQLTRSPSFNSISLEQAVRIIYEAVRPIDVDLSTPTSVTTVQPLEARVVDPEVIKVDWSVDGEVVAEDHGYLLDVEALALPAGSHSITARAYDDTDWVRGDRDELEQTLEWTIDVP